MRKLYVFTNTIGDGCTGWEECLSMADDGYVLGSHICSSVYFMRGDLVDRPDRMAKIVGHFKGKEGIAFEVVLLKPREVPPEDVQKLNKELGEKAYEKADLASVTVEVER